MKLDWEKVAKAKLHPTQVYLLGRLAKGGSVSPVVVSRDIGKSLGTVSYHMKALSDAGLVTLVDTKARRGAVEHFYEIAKAAMR